LNHSLSFVSVPWHNDGNNSMSDALIKDTKQKMQSGLEAFRQDLGRIRTGRATPSLIEGLMVEAYGSMMKLQEVASIAAPEATLLVVQPWDASLANTIANAIRNSDLHLNPAVEGNVLRIPLPPLTQERRQEFVKLVNKRAEEARVEVRGHRHDALAALKRAKDNGDLSQDEQQMYEKRIQEAVEDLNKQIDTLASAKEQELMKV
jgi:ribosome recycling factor